MSESRKAKVAAWTALALLVAQAPLASAQSSTAAEALFNDGQRLMAQGKTHEACLKFAESQKQDQAIGTLINLALCHEKEGKIASATTEYNDAAAEATRAGQQDRAQYAKQHAQALEKNLHKLVIGFKDAPPNAEVKLDGAAFGIALLGTAVPVDPGEHTVEATAPGKKPWSQKITAAADAGTDHLDIPALVDLPPETTPPAAGAKGQTSGPFVPPPRDEEPHANKTKLAVGYIALGTGVVAAGLTGYFAYRFVTYNNRYNDQKNCAPPDDGVSKGADNTPCAGHTYAEVKDNRTQAITNQDIMLVTGGVAVIGLGVGAFFLITASSGSDKSSAMTVLPSLGPHEAGLSATGRF